jgi:hypothetical protein
MATPLSVVKERFESKDKLVAAVEKLATKELWIGRVNDVKGLKRASNKKLIRLHDLLEDAKKRFGNRDKLIQSIAELAQRPKDKDWLASLAGYPLPQLLDLHRSFDRAARSRPAVEKKPKKEKKPMVKKPSAKAQAPKAEAPKVEAPKAAPAKAEAKKAEPKAEAKKAEPKAEKKAEAKSKPSASKPAASKEPVAKKAAAAKKTPAKKA